MGLVLPFTVIAIVCGYLWYFYKNVRRYPRGPTPLPIVGTIFSFRPTEVPAYLGELSKIYGNVFTIWLPQPIVCILNYDTIKEAFRGDDIAGRSTAFPDTIFQVIPNGGVIFANGESWRYQRRLALHVLRDFGMGKQLMEKEVQVSAMAFLDHLQKMESCDEVNFRWPLQVFIGNIISKLLYGIDYDYDNCDRVKKYCIMTVDLFARLRKNKLIFLAAIFPWIEKIPIIGYYCVGQYRKVINQTVDIIREDVDVALKGYDVSMEPENVTQAYYQKVISDGTYNSEQLINMCFDFYLAGMETTSTTLRWAVLYMAKYPEVQKNMRTEIERVVGFDRIICMSDRPALPYCSATINELQRHSNIISVNVFHRTVQDTYINGVPIPENTRVLGNISSVLTNGEVYTNPEEFRPERFLTEDGKLEKSEALEHLIPFSIGKRQCAGEGLAKVQLFIGLLSLIQKFQIVEIEGSEICMDRVDVGVCLPKDQSVRLIPVNSNV